MLAFLTNVSDRLAPLLTFEDLIDVMRRLPVPFLADWTMVHVVNDDGSVRFIPGVHADPALEPLVAAAAAPTARLASLPHLGQVVSTGRVAIIALTAEDAASGLLGVPGSAPTLERLGAGSIAMLPLVVDG